MILRATSPEALAAESRKNWNRMSGKVAGKMEDMPVGVWKKLTIPIRQLIAPVSQKAHKFLQSVRARNLTAGTGHGV